MFKELKYNFEMIFRSPTFRLGTVLLIGVVIFTFSGMFKDNKLLQTPYAGIIVSRMFLIITFGLILLCILFILQDSILLEKISGRIEQLLSNGFKPRSYWYGSTVATAVTTEIIILFIFLVFCIFRLHYFPEVPIARLINTLLPLLFLNIGISSLSCALVLKIKRVDIIRSLLFFIPYLIFFGGNKLIIKIQPKLQSMLLWGIFITGILLVALSIFIIKGLNSENIVLTIP